MQPLEKMLDDVFKQMPSLPEEARKGLAQAMPWVTLVGGVLSLLAAWYLYQAVAWINQWAGAVNSVYGATGYTSPVGSIGIVAWVSLAILAAQAILFLVAFPALRSFKKTGWDLLLWAAVANIAYDVLYNLFGGYMNIGQLIFSLIGAAIGLYLLFQVRSYFNTGAQAVKAAPKAEVPAEKPVKKD
jgi:uncharacterized membrane protein YuzA (DUF378 family)